MARVTVSESAIRELVREAFDGGYLGDLTVPDEEPVNVNDVVDPSAAVTDPINPNFAPQTRPELDVALKQLTKALPIDKVPGTYKAFKAVIDADELETREGEEMKKVAQGGSKQVEEAVRLAVRKMLNEITPRFDASYSGTDYGDSGDDDDDDEKEKKPKRAYKKTALGNMEDVGGASFDEIAKDLGFSIAGAKQAVDKALEKARWMATQIEPEDLEILVLTTMNDYIKVLAKTGELSAADVQLMKDHPEIVRELDGFREFLHNAVRRARKSDQKVENPLGEADGPNAGDQVSMKSVAGDKQSSGAKPAAGKVTKAKGASGKNIEVDWGGFSEGKKLSQRKKK